jgi:alanine racemase
MGQAEVRVDLEAIRSNLIRLRQGTQAEVMAVVKGDGYGHGLVASARAAVQGGATWLGACTLDEALELRRAGLTVPVLAWLLAPGLPLHLAVEASVDLSASSTGLLGEIVAAARRTGHTARLHLKLDTGLSRGGATAVEWTELCEAAAKFRADGAVEVVGIWSHLVHADVPDHVTTDAQLAAFTEGLEVARRFDIRPAYRHLANSAATLTRPDTHFDLVRPGIATYGLSPVPGRDFGLRPAMSVRATVVQTKRVPDGQGISYGHTYTTTRPTTVALVPLGYADGVPRAASNVGPVRLAGANRTIAGRVCMDQIVVACDDDPVAAGDVAVLFGPGDDGEPTAEDWAEATGTISYEIVTRMGSSRVPRVYDGLAFDDGAGSPEGQQVGHRRPPADTRRPGGAVAHDGQMVVDEVLP